MSAPRAAGSPPIVPSPELLEIHISVAVGVQLDEADRGRPGGEFREVESLVAVGVLCFEDPPRPFGFLSGSAGGDSSTAQEPVEVSVELPEVRLFRRHFVLFQRKQAVAVDVPLVKIPLGAARASGSVRPRAEFLEGQLPVAVLVLLVESDFRRCQPRGEFLDTQLPVVVSVHERKRGLAVPVLHQVRCARANSSNERNPSSS